MQNLPESDEVASPMRFVNCVVCGVQVVSHAHCRGGLVEGASVDISWQGLLGNLRLDPPDLDRLRNRMWNGEMTCVTYLALKVIITSKEKSTRDGEGN